MLSVAIKSLQNYFQQTNQPGNFNDTALLVITITVKFISFVKINANVAKGMENHVMKPEFK